MPNILMVAVLCVSLMSFPVFAQETKKSKDAPTFGIAPYRDALGDVPMINTFEVSSLIGNSCGNWVKFNEDTRAVVYFWFRGFVSGHNFSTPNNQVKTMPDAQTTYLYIDKYCREKPLNNFFNAAFRLVEELRNQ